MITAPLKILIIDNNQADIQVVRNLLETANPENQFYFASDPDTFLKGMQVFGPDIVISEMDTPGLNATAALEMTRQHSSHVPFILATKLFQDELIPDLLKSGADDFVLKDRLARLPFAVEAALARRQPGRDKQQGLVSLRQSEEQYRSIFSNSPLPKWIYDFETLRFLEVNQAAIQHYGYTEEEFLRMTIKDIRPEEDHAKLSSDLLKIKQEPNIRKGDWRHIKKNGEEIIVRTSAHFIPYKGIKARIVVIIDITERVKAEQLKEFDRNNLSALINNTRDMMWSVDKNLKLITSNDAFNHMVEKVTGHPMQPGETVLPIALGNEWVTRYREFYARALSGEAFTILEYIDVPEPIWSDISFYPIRQGNVIVGTACFSRDITSTKLAQDKLRSIEKRMLSQKIQAQKKVTRAMIKGQERERNHIGRELHDNVNQLLVSAKLYLDIAANKNPDLKRLTEYPVELINNCIQEIRSLTSGYVAPLKNIDLRELVQSVLDKVENGSVITTKLIYEMDAPIGDELKLNLYRIIQEQLNNIVKHAHAKDVTVSLSILNNQICLSITDDGVGFNTTIQRKGIGVSNMINRVEMFNGNIRIDSAPGAGCSVHVNIPVEASKS